jgi:hypothetical protein
MSEDEQRSYLLRLLATSTINEMIDIAVSQADVWHRYHPNDLDVREARRDAAERQGVDHPIRLQLRERTRMEIVRFFDTYYDELKAEVKKHDEPSDPLPHYRKGYRKIRTYWCTDGVLIGHKKADEGEEKNAYTFTLSENKVKELADHLYNQPLPGGRKLDPVINYQDGEEFHYALRVPRKDETPLDETHVGGFESEWTRLDFASLNHLDSWRSESKAR